MDRILVKFNSEKPIQNTNAHHSHKLACISEGPEAAGLGRKQLYRSIPFPVTHMVITSRMWLGLRIKRLFKSNKQHANITPENRALAFAI